jgi:predicted ATPase
MKTIPKIVLTGGPCGGKSMGMKFLAEKLLEKGYYPVQVPEAPTILSNAGVTPVGGVVPLREFQESVVDLILSLEAIADRTAYAVRHEKPVIICDRGIMDTKAYMPPGMFEEVMKGRLLNAESMRDGRYHAVFHLRSAAVGAEHAYTKENNAARFETLDEARLADTRTLLAWHGHPNLMVIGNEGKTFDDKLSLLWEKVRYTLERPPS